MQISTSIFEQIKSELSNLPGITAHQDMVPFRLSAKSIYKTSIDYKLSAVLILLYIRDGNLYFILTERQDYNGKHAGQISFPGGKAEPKDTGTDFTALRETEEEIGVPIDRVTILGQLTDVYISVSNFLIHPYIGFLASPPLIKADEREVKSVLHCSIHQLLDEKNRVVTKIKTDKGIWMKNIPCFILEEKIVWGATAVILNEFKFILKRFL